MRGLQNQVVRHKHLRILAIRLSTMYPARVMRMQLTRLLVEPVPVSRGVFESPTPLLIELVIEDRNSILPTFFANSQRWF